MKNLISLQEDIQKTVKEMTENIDLSRTMWLPLYQDGNKTWALVFGWMGDFNPEEADGVYQLDDSRLCGKIAYNDTYMKDYDIDWVMPLDNEGEVIDTETSLAEDILTKDGCLKYIQYWQNDLDYILSVKSEREQEELILE